MLKKAERQHIEDMVRAAEFALRPSGLISLSYKFDRDWTDDEGIFFECFIADAVGQEHVLLETTKRISEAVRRIVEPDEYGLLSYFNWKLESDVKRQQKEAECSLKS